ncbi:protein-tyrosine kinase activator TkmA, partial [Escherichia coli]|nr:protein-tyrosine kinase activator TkmA [Escherichia coli]
LLNIAIAFAAGLAGSIGLAFLLEHLDNTIKSEEQLESLLDIPVLGTVSTIANEQKTAKTLQGFQSEKTGSGHFGA